MLTPCFSAAWQAFRTASCSIVVAMMWGEEVGEVKEVEEVKDKDATPKMAWLSDSVPPLVKTISWGRAPISAATCSRAVSTAARARWPGVWMEEALAKSAEK